MVVCDILLICCFKKDMQRDINEAEIKRIAALCKIQLTGDDIEKYSHDLSRILEYIRMLEQVDTKDVEPTFSVNDRQNVMSEDKVRPSLSREEVLAGACEKDLVYIKTKGVFND